MNLRVEFGIITIAIEMADSRRTARIGQVAREKPIFWLKSQYFEHLNLCNLNLFSLPQNVVFRGI